MSIPLRRPVPGEAVRDALDRLAGVYARAVHPLESGVRRRSLGLLAPAAGERILAVGCGPGGALVSIGRAVGPGGLAVGVDAAPGMAGSARRCCRQAGVEDRAGAVRGSPDALPVRTGSVDAVYLADALGSASPGGIETVLAECARVLRPEGRVCVVTMDHGEAGDSPFVPAYGWLSRVVPGYGYVGHRPVDARGALDRAGFRVETEERVGIAGVWPTTIRLARPA